MIFDLFKIFKQFRYFQIVNLYSIFFLLIPLITFSQKTYNNEFHFSFQVNNKSEINQFSKLLSIEKIEGNTVFAYANSKQFKNFKKLDKKYAIIENTATNLKISKSISELKEWNTYPTYLQYITLMNDFATNYPDICSLHEIGESINGHKILAVKISDNVSDKEAEPEFFYSSTIHGNELVGYVLSLRLIDYLLSNYSNPKIANLINNCEIWINPLANPDGTYAQSDTIIANKCTRNNANGIDLNRNYPDPEDGEHPDGNDWQPENIAMMDFMNEHNFVLSANIHTGVEVINYPWDTWSKLHADNSWFRYISRMYVDTVHVNSYSGYFDYLENGITNGYQWYTISGGRQDYANYFLHGREVTIEISSNHIPSEIDLPYYWNYNYKSLVNYIEQSLYGISGIITDSITGEPLKATIEVLNYDKDNSYIYSDATNGNYHRLIAEGNYSLKFTAYNHRPKTIENISVTNNQTTNLNVELVAFGDGIQAKNINRFEILSYNNPISNNIASFSIISQETTKCSLKVFSITGRKIIEKENIPINNGDNFLEINLEKFDEGLYIFQFYVSDLIIEKKVIKLNK